MISDNPTGLRVGALTEDEGGRRGNGGTASPERPDRSYDAELFGLTGGVDGGAGDELRDRRGDRRPPDGPVGPLRAALSRPLLVALTVLVVLLPAVALGLTRSATHTASAQVLVGRVDVEANAVPGFVSAVQQLAGTYSRLVTTTELAERVAGEIGVPVQQVQPRLSASPVPESSIINVEATAPDEQSAVRLADAATRELIEFVQEQNTPNTADDPTLIDYREASVARANASLLVDQAQTALTRAAASGDAAAATAARQALSQAQADLAAADLRVSTLATVFQSNQRGGTERNNLRQISTATSSGSDRGAVLGQLVAAAVVLGGAAGVALATAVANVSARRRGRAARAS